MKAAICLLLGLVACARTVPLRETRLGASSEPPEEIPESAAEAVAPVVALSSRNAQELIDESGAASFAEEHYLHVASIDQEVAERWFTHPPRVAYLYAERPIEGVAASGEGRAVLGQCQGLRHSDSVAINEVDLVLSQAGGFRTLLELRGGVALSVERWERGAWDTSSVRGLPMKVVVWDEHHIRYAEGATRYVAACVPTVRTVSCTEEESFLGPRAHCLDERLVVRPWRMPDVPHVGAVIPGYHDPVPPLPQGDCAVRCERSECEAARRLAAIPRDVLYEESAPALAVFRTREACRRFASSREDGRAPARRCDDGDCW